MFNIYPFRLIFTLAFILVLTGCSKEQDNIIRFGLSTAPVTLDPRYATDAVSHRINRLLYKRLVDFDKNYNIVPVLASWEQITPRHYRFHLNQEGRKFHNGDYLKAEDVKATYDSIINPENVSPHRAILLNIYHIEVQDADTIDFRLRVEDPLFPGRLVIGILPKKLVNAEHKFQELPVGTGGMRLHVWPSEDRIILKRDSDGQLFEFVTVKDSTVRVQKLVKGELDLIQGDLPYELLDWLENKEAITVEKSQGNVFSYIGFNMQDRELSKISVRKAIAHAIDRGAIIKNVFRNAAHKAETLLPPEHWATHGALDSYLYDPDKSRMLLQEAGYGDNNKLELTYKTSNNPFRVRLATIIQNQLQQVGIDVEVQSYDWGTFYGDIKDGRFQMYSLSWVGLNMPDIFRYAFHSNSIPPGGANRGRYVDPLVDILIDTAEKKSTLDEQAAVYRELQTYLHQQLPYVPLWYEDNILVRRNNISGYVLSPDGDYDSLLSTQKLN